jgi:hypothetical protein
MSRTSYNPKKLPDSALGLEQAGSCILPDGSLYAW